MIASKSTHVLFFILYRMLVN